MRMVRGVRDSDVGPGQVMVRRHDGVDSMARALRTRRWRYRVVRHDGTLLGVSQSRETAERMADVMRQGQRADHVVVLHPQPRRA